MNVSNEKTESVKREERDSIFSCIGNQAKQQMYIWNSNHKKAILKAHDYVQLIHDYHPNLHEYMAST